MIFALWVCFQHTHKAVAKGRFYMKRLFVLLLTLCLLAAFTACGSDNGGEASSAQPETQGTSIGADAPDAADTADAADTSEEEVLVPIYASQLQDGSYEITVDSSSSMFRVIHCELIVENDSMKAVMTMSGDGYGMVYMGTGEEALLDSEDAYVPFVLDEVGAKTFTVPIEALDMELDCAAWSIRKEKWYDRTLIFMSQMLPTEAITGK